jgi:hypothetical protein
MATRRRKAVLAAGVAAVPLVLLQQPAGAAETQAVKSGSLDFIAFDGRPIHCSALVDAVHDTDDAEQPLLSWSTEADTGPDCEGSFKIIATYEDVNGTGHQVRYTTTATSFGGVNGAFAPASVTLEIDYAQCDPELSTSCTLALTASPK